MTDKERIDLLEVEAAIAKRDPQMSGEYFVFIKITKGETVRQSIDKKFAEGHKNAGK